MPDRRDPPPTDEGWYALHDFRSIDWDAWRGATERERRRGIEEGREYLGAALAVEDAADGASALYSVLGHKADLLVVHLRPSTADIGALERRFERTELAGFTERTTSFVSVTEASGYSEQARAYFGGDLDEDSGLSRYIRTRLEPTIPDATHVCFYPMDKRRDPDQNWYDLPFEERAEHMEAHGDIGRDYAGRVTQMITGAIGIDDWEWGVTLWGDSLTDVKDLLYEMRFDPSTSQFAEFGPFYVGRRIPPSDLAALLAGDRVPTAESDVPEGERVDRDGPSDAGRAGGDAGDDGSHGGAHPGSPAEGDHPHDGGVDRGSEAGTEREPEAEGTTGGEASEEENIDGLLSAIGLQAGEDYSAGDHALVVYSEADADALAEEVDGLRGNFEHYDSHVSTTVRAHGGRGVVASVWTTGDAAETASGFLADLPGVTETVRGPVGGSGTRESATEGSADIREALAEEGIYAGQPHGEDIYALVRYSEADRETLIEEVEELRDGFERYDTHEGTSVYADREGGPSAVVSRWATQDAAETASGFLADLPGAVGWAGEGEGFGTMGMFYTVKPAHREEFVERFGAVEELVAGMDGHRGTALLVNCEDENDMFIASRWDSREDAMEFFRSDAFADTVEWGRDVLADRPRHVFLA